VGSNELAWVRLEFEVLISLQDVRRLTTAERTRLTHLLRNECELVGLGDELGDAELVPRTTCFA
jgi:hypothetical protein